MIQETLFDDEPYYYPGWARWEPLTPELLPQELLWHLLIESDMED